MCYSISAYSGLFQLFLTDFQFFQLWSDRKHCITSILLICWVVVYDQECDLSWPIWAWKECIFCWCWMKYSIDVNCLQLMWDLLRSTLCGFPGSSVVKNPWENAGATGDADLIPRSGRSPGEGNGHTLQYSCQDNPMDKGTWWATVHGVAKSQILH